jgi:hypothetical protein
VSITETYCTPEQSPPEYISVSERKCSHDRTVQFGPSKAVEYHCEEASIYMNVMPTDVATTRYPHHEPISKHEDEEDVSLITKQNTEILAAWDEEFAVFEDDEEGTDEDDCDDWYTISHRNCKRERRESKIFSPSPGNTSLLDDEDDSSADIARLSRLSVLSPPARVHAVSSIVSMDDTADKVTDKAVNDKFASAHASISVLTSTLKSSSSTAKSAVPPAPECCIEVSSKTVLGV